MESVAIPDRRSRCAADKTSSIPEADRKAYAAAYARPGRMRAGWAYFVSFLQAAKDFAQLSQTKLRIPVLVIGGEKSLGEVLAQGCSPKTGHKKE